MTAVELTQARESTGTVRSGFWRRYIRNPLVLVASAFLVIAAIGAVVGPLLLDPFAFSDVTYGSPSFAHPMGTDHLGRDIFSQVVLGTRSALIVGLGTSLLAAAVGTAIGALAGYFGGPVDGLLMRLTDVVLTLPTFFVVLLVGILFGGGLVLITVILGLAVWTGTARVVRAEVLGQKERGYVEAARAIGASHRHLLIKEILPNSIHPAIALISLTAAWAILAEAGLSFLGLRDPAEVTWGWMLQTAMSHYTSAWWMAVFPGAALSALVLAFNLVGDGINDARNPRVREGRSRQKRRQQVGEASSTSSVPGVMVESLSVEFPVGGRSVEVIDEVSFQIAAGEIVGLVGESGSGKTMTALSMVGLIPTPGYASGGRVLLDSVDVVAADPEQLRKLRANSIAIAFQDPQSSLNPLLTVGDQLIESAVAAGIPTQDVHEAAVSAMESVRIPAPRERMNAYPHQLSGGMRQRVLLAIALIRRPKILILDEPTTALDVITQNEILDLIRDGVASRGLGVLLITHDLSVVAQTCDRVLVMYAGRIVETGETSRLLEDPQHPYTQGLVQSIPGLAAAHGPLATIPGTVPQPDEFPAGCRFHTRCPAVMLRCRDEQPPFFAGPTSAACWLIEHGRAPNVWREQVTGDD